MRKGYHLTLHWVLFQAIEFIMNSFQKTVPEAKFEWTPATATNHHFAEVYASSLLVFLLSFCCIKLIIATITFIILLLWLLFQFYLFFQQLRKIYFENNINEFTISFYFVFFLKVFLQVPHKKEIVTLRLKLFEVYYLYYFAISS